MKACLISCFGYYEQRLKYVEKVLERKGYEVIHIVSDFDHLLKQKISSQGRNMQVIHVPAYKKNISLRRIASHWIFSKKTASLLKKEQPDLVYSTIPPNLLCRYLAKNKKKQNYTLIFDIYDLWPESFPIRRTDLLPFRVWKGFRSRYLKTADYVLLECAYYINVLQQSLEDTPYQVMYLCREQMAEPLEFQFRSDMIHLCYLGSINHIIDIDYIVELLAAIKSRKGVFLHIIGNGDNTQKLLCLLKERQIDYKYYGSVFSEKEKCRIFQKCLFGINIYKKETSIGLTMKSVDYLQAGLPLLTCNIRDTDQLTQEYGLGYVVDDIQAAADALVHLSYETWMQMCQNVREVFEHQFSSAVFEQKLAGVIETLAEKL